jgi:hypothetical protein
MEKEEEPFFHTTTSAIKNGVPFFPLPYVRNSYTPSPLRYALTKKPVRSGTTM